MVSSNPNHGGIFVERPLLMMFIDIWPSFLSLGLGVICSNLFPVYGDRLEVYASPTSRGNWYFYGFWIYPLFFKWNLFRALNWGSDGWGVLLSPVRPVWVRAFMDVAVFVGYAAYLVSGTVLVSGTIRCRELLWFRKLLWFSELSRCRYLFSHELFWFRWLLLFRELLWYCELLRFSNCLVLQLVIV